MQWKWHSSFAQTNQLREKNEKYPLHWLSPHPNSFEKKQLRNHPIPELCCHSNLLVPQELPLPQKISPANSHLCYQASWNLNHPSEAFKFQIQNIAACKSGLFIPVLPLDSPNCLLHWIIFGYNYSTDENLPINGRILRVYHPLSVITPFILVTMKFPLTAICPPTAP